MQEAKLTNYQKKKRAELLLAVKKSRPKLAKEKLNKLDEFVKQNEPLLEEMKERKRQMNSPQIDLETLNKQTTKVAISDAEVAKRKASIESETGKIIEVNRETVSTKTVVGQGQVREKLSKQANVENTQVEKPREETALAGKVLDSDKKQSVEEVNIESNKNIENRSRKNESSAKVQAKQEENTKKQTIRQVEPDLAKKQKEAGIEKVYNVEIVEADEENKGATKNADKGNIKTVVLTQVGVREKKEKKKKGGIFGFFKKEKKGPNKDAGKEDISKVNEVSSITKAEKEEKIKPKKVQGNKETIKQDNDNEIATEEKQSTRQKKNFEGIVKLLWRELSKVKAIRSIAAEYSKTIDYKKLEADENYTTLERKDYITTFFDIVTDRIFKPTEERQEYTAFLEEGVIDEKYSLRLAKQIAVITGLFAFSLIIIGIYENIFKELIHVTFIREVIFFVPLALFYVIVIKASKQLRIKDLFPISALTGGIYELVIAAILLFLNMYIFSSLFVAVIGIFLLYFGVTRLDLDLNKISKQLTPPDKDKVCPSCGRTIPKGENYCHNCERWVY